MRRTIKVGLIQQSCTGNTAENMDKLKHSIEDVASKGAELVVLQELHNTLYFCQTENTSLFDLAETIPGPSTEFYSGIASANGIVLVTSLFEKRAPGQQHRQIRDKQTRSTIVGQPADHNGKRISSSQ